MKKSERTNLEKKLFIDIEQKVNDSASVNFKKIKGEHIDKSKINSTIENLVYDIPKKEVFKIPGFNLRRFMIAGLSSLCVITMIFILIPNMINRSPLSEQETNDLIMQTTTETPDKNTQVTENPGKNTQITEMTASGYAHTIALRKNGTVWGWGNDFGGMSSDVPVQIQGLSDVIYIASGNQASAAIKSDGTLWMWGTGWTSDGAMNSYDLSLDKPYMTDVVDVSIGDYFTVALKNDGTVWVWGSDSSSDMEDQKIPKKLEGLPKIKKIATSWYHAAFLDIDGNVWFLEEQYILPRVPKKVEGLKNIMSITGGGHHFIALKDDGTVFQFAECDNNNKSPEKVEELSDIVDIAAGAFHSIAVKKDGTVWSWGELEHGLGDGINTKSKTPVKVDGITNAVGISSGNWHTTITASDGSLWSWGSNYMGQLGYGVNPDDKYDQSTNRETPVQVVF